MNDIDYFSEEKMYALKLKDFENSLPSQLKLIYIAAFRQKKRYPLHWLTGYQGPSRLLKSGSKMSQADEGRYGVQKISFKYDIPTYMTWNILVHVLYKLEEGAEHYNGWSHMYFKAATGGMLDEEQAKSIQQKNQEAETCFQNGEKLFQNNNYEEAFNEFKKAFDGCDVGYKSQTAFKEAMNKASFALCKIKVKNLFKEADDLFEQKKFEKSLDKCKEIVKISNDPDEKYQSKEKQCLILKNIGDQLGNKASLNEAMEKYKEALQMTSTQETIKEIDDSIALIYSKEGEIFFNQARFKEAAFKLKQAIEKTNKHHDRENFIFKQTQIEHEINVSKEMEKAALLVNEKKLEQATEKYKKALQMTQVEIQKEKIEGFLDEIEEKLKTFQITEKEDDNAKNIKILEFLNEGLNLICQGNLLQSKGKIEAADGLYIEASKCFEAALKILPTNNVFNGYLSLINCFYEIQEFDEANECISKLKRNFPDKISELKEISESINARDCSLNYLNRFKMEEIQKSENQKNYSRNVKF